MSEAFWLLRPEDLFLALFGKRQRPRQAPQLTDPSSIADQRVRWIYEAYQRAVGRDPTAEEVDRILANVFNPGALASIARTVGIHTKAGRSPDLNDQRVAQAVRDFLFDLVSSSAEPELIAQRSQQEREALQELAQERTRQELLGSLLQMAFPKKEPVKTLALRQLELQEKAARQAGQAAALQQFLLTPYTNALNLVGNLREAALTPLQIASQVATLESGRSQGGQGWPFFLASLIGGLPGFIDVILGKKKK